MQTSSQPRGCLEGSFNYERHRQTTDHRFLAENIKDDRKRLAFRLYMDDVPFKSKRHHSIAKALGIDEKTARLWIEEIKAQLKEKIGDLT